RCDHDALNASQRAAVQLCSDSDLAFIWGPPGTGKTATLTHVIEELLAQDRRSLLVSTTNAAIDQVIAQMAGRPWFAAAVEAGRLIRLGRSDEETFGAELGDVVRRAQGELHRSIEWLRARIAQVEQQARNAELLLAEVAVAAVAQQSLFTEPRVRLRAGALSSVFPPGLAEVVASRTPQDQAAEIACRLGRLTRIRTLASERVARHAAAVREIEGR